MYGSPGKETARLTFGASGHVMKTESAAKRTNAAACFFDVTNGMIAARRRVPRSATSPEASSCSRISCLCRSCRRPDCQMPHRVLRLELDASSSPPRKPANVRILFNRAASGCTMIRRPSTTTFLKRRLSMVISASAAPRALPVGDASADLIDVDAPEDVDVAESHYRSRHRNAAIVGPAYRRYSLIEANAVGVVVLDRRVPSPPAGANATLQPKGRRRRWRSPARETDDARREQERRLERARWKTIRDLMTLLQQ